MSRHPLLLALWAALLLGIGANLQGVWLFDEDEGSFAQASLEMVNTGDWIRISLDGELHHHKPILIYWLQATAITLFGAHEWAVRLPSVIAAVLWLIALMGFIRQPSELALHIGMALTTSLGFVLIGRAATADSLLNLFLCLTLFAMYRCFTQTNAPKWPVFLWMGLGVLTKGPVAIVIPFIVSGLLWTTAGRGREWLGNLVDWRGWLVFLLVLLPWGSAIYAQLGLGFFTDFLMVHNLQRFTTPFQGHQGSVLYYLWVLPLMLLPWSGLLLALPWKNLIRAPIDRFCLIWFLTVFILFTLAQTKLPHYLIYGMTPILILFVRHTAHLTHRWWALPGLLGFALFAALPYLLGQFVRPTDARIHEAELVARALAIFETHQLSLVALGFLLAAGLIAATGSCGVFKRLALMGLMQNAFLSFVLLPQLAAIQQQPIVEAARLAAHQPTVAYRTVLPSFSFYRQQPTPRRLPAVGEWVFLRADKVAALQRELPTATWRTHYAQGGIRLLERLP